jgi:hypothetical protein
MINWSPHVSPIVSGIILLVLGLWLAWVYRRNRKVYSKTRSLVLLAPKILIVILVMFALLDPFMNTVRPPQQREKVRVIIDVSSSMDVKDRKDSSRVKRARKLSELARDRLDKWVDMEFRTFDTQLHAPDTKPTDTSRGTDLGTCMAAMAEEEGMPGYAAVLMLTDGGDDPIQTARVPGPPLFIIGTGTDPSTWNDLALSNVDAPETVEEHTPFEVSADIVAHRADSGFASRSSVARLTVSEETAAGWKKLEERSVDLKGASERITLEMPPVETEGIKRYRMSIEPVAGELSLLNNDRIITVDVRKKEVYVLFYSRYMDWDFTLLKRALKDDPAVKITSLYRKGNDTMGQALLRLEGERREGDEILKKGFPSDEKLLASYRCIIIGSFPAREMNPPQYEALLRYVEEGGSVIFLGGRDSFGRGGFGETAVAPLIPWHISRTEREMTAGAYPVTATDLAMEHNATAAAARTLCEVPVPEIYSVNHVGRLRPGAVSLMDVTVGRRVIAVVALQPYGLGQTIGIATDTLWRWGRKRGKLKKVHSQFWQQVIRYMCGNLEGGRFLSIKWDRSFYRPSEMAEAEIRVIGQKQMSGQLRLKGELVKDGVREELPVDPVLGKEGCYRTRIYFSGRGVYLFRLEAFIGTERLDLYERKFRVAPKVNEGSSLELDEPFLADLAGRCGGYYENESDADKLIETIRKKVMAGSVRASVPLVQEKLIYLIVFMFILIAEWCFRRRINIF